MPNSYVAFRGPTLMPALWQRNGQFGGHLSHGEEWRQAFQILRRSVPKVRGSSTADRAPLFLASIYTLEGLIRFPSPDRDFITSDRLS